MLREVRLGLALNGGVSLAIWIGGVVDEFLRAVSAGQGHPEAQPEWVDLCRELDVQVADRRGRGHQRGRRQRRLPRRRPGERRGQPRRPAEPLDRQRRLLPAAPPAALGRGPVAAARRHVLPAEPPDAPSRPWPRADGASGSLDPPLDIRLTSTDLQRQGAVASPTGRRCCSSVDHTVEFRFTDQDFHFAASPRRRPGWPGPAARPRRSRAPSRRAPCRRGSSRRGTPPPSRSTGPSWRPTSSTAGCSTTCRLATRSRPSRASRPGSSVHRALALVVPDPGGQAAGDGEPRAAARRRPSGRLGHRHPPQPVAVAVRQRGARPQQRRQQPPCRAGRLPR